MRRVAALLSSVVLFALSACGSSGPNPVVEMETSMGTIKIELYQDKAPISTANFLAYVDQKHYDGTIFHRVIEDFMIQGGGFAPGMKGEKPSLPPIRNEAGNGLSNDRGTIAMARTNDPDSATAQFFINVKNNPNLNRGQGRGREGYAVFGKVISGMNVVDEIREVETADRGGHENVPVKDVIIKSVRRVETK